MSTRDELDRACRDETELALELHDQARAYVAGNLDPETFLNGAHRYGLARLRRECLQGELWGPEP